MNRIGIAILFLAILLGSSCKSQNFYWSHTYVESGVDTCFGYLYNWYTAQDSRELTSSDDWIVPANTDLSVLLSYLGGGSTQGGKLKETGLTHWDAPNGGATNETGFSSRGAGQRSYTSGGFTNLKGTGYVMYKNQLSATNMFGLQTTFASTNTTNISTGKSGGFSIRLLYTGVGSPTSYTGNDGKVYSVVQIGTQYWTTENLEETLYRNLDPIPNVTDNTTWAGLTTGAWCVYDNNDSYKCK